MECPHITKCKQKIVAGGYLICLKDSWNHDFCFETHKLDREGPIRNIYLKTAEEWASEASS